MLLRSDWLLMISSHQVPESDWLLLMACHQMLRSDRLPGIVLVPSLVDGVLDLAQRYVLSCRCSVITEVIVMTMLRHISNSDKISCNRIEFHSYRNNHKDDTISRNMFQNSKYMFVISQYSVEPPFAAITAAHLQGMLSINFFSKDASNPWCHYLISKLINSCSVFGPFFITQSPRIFQSSSMGFKSGKLPGQLKVFTLFFTRYSFTHLAWWHGALLSWNIALWTSKSPNLFALSFMDGRKCVCRILKYSSWFTTFSQM